MTIDKLINFLLALFFVMVPALSLFMGALGRQGKMKSIMFVVPFVSVLIVVNHQFHLQLILLGLVLPFSLPESLVQRTVNMSVLVPFLVFAGMVARTLMGKTNTKASDKVMDIIMRLVSFEAVLWIVIRFPGFETMGSSHGGGWQAVLAVSGLCAYWGIRSLRGIKPNWEKLQKLLLGGAIIGLIWISSIAAYKYRALGSVAKDCFFSTGWWFYGLILGITIKIWRPSGQLLSTMPTYAVSGVLLFHALLSSYRSRILFAPFMVGVALWCGGMRKLMIAATIVFFAICVFFANSSMYNRFPGSARRVLSVVRLAEDNASDAKELGEMGRSSPWRMKVWSSAWEEILKNPVLGRGYAHSAALFVPPVVTETDEYNAMIRGLVLSGEAHNTPLNLMYFWGIPMALLFCAAWIRLLGKLVKQASQQEGWYGAFFVALLVWTVAETGQALMNGTGPSFVTICTSMGIYQAIKPEKEDDNPVDGKG